MLKNVFYSREEKDNFPDEQDIVEIEEIEQEDKTYWVNPTDEGSQVYNARANDKDHGSKDNEMVDFKDNNEKNTEHRNEQSENRNKDDFGEKEKEIEAFDFDKDDSVDVMENASQSNGRQENRGGAKETITKRTSKKTNRKLDKTRGSAVDTISRALNQMFESDDHRRTSAIESMDTKENSKSNHVTESDDQAPSLLTELKDATKMPTSDYMIESNGSIPTSATEPTDTTRKSVSSHVTETDNVILSNLTVSKNVTGIPTSDHVTKLDDPTPKSTTEATDSTETSASSNVTETDKLILSSLTVSKNVTGIPTTEYVTKSEGKTPILKTESKSKLATLAADHVTESDNKSTILTKLYNKTETSVSSMTRKTTPTSKSLITLIFTETKNNTGDDDDDDDVNDSDDDDINDNNNVKISVSTPRPHYTIEPAVSRNNSSRHDVCNFPKLDPFDKSILHLLKDVGTNPGCRERYPEPLFDVMNNRLIPKKDKNISNEIEFESLRVETIHRNENDDDNFHTKDQGNPFVMGNDFVVGSYMNGSDFFRLKYTLKNGDDIEHYFSRVVPKERVILQSENAKEDLASKKNKAKGIPLNVLIIGIDSTAANNFYRKLQHTLAFLRSKLNTYFFKGYSVIGDATTPALCALLTGKKEHELPEGRQGYYGAESVDKWPWLSKNYKAHGYATLFTEDDPRVGAFNLRLLGFREPPYDHYSRPFWLALEDAGARDGPGLCSKSISMVNYTIEYLKSYFEAYPDTAKFAFAFAGYLAHAHPNHLSYADYDLLHLLKFLVKNKHDENTMLVLLGDHGSRNDDVRNTMQGKLEERLPWLSISLPKWVEKQYPGIGKAMKWNQDKLCTPFDVHYTLIHMLTYPIRPSRERGMSLFDKIPTNRTCEDAGK